MEKKKDLHQGGEAQMLYMAVYVYITFLFLHYIGVIMCALTWKSRILMINLELVYWKLGFTTY